MATIREQILMPSPAMTPGGKAALRPDRRLMALCAAAGGFELVVGFVYPAVALNLELQGVSADMIGYQAAMIGLGMALSPLAVPWLAGWFGTMRLCAANIMLGLLALLAFAMSDSVGTWLLVSLIFGMATSIWYVQSETWINQVAGEPSRGRAIGLFSTLREGGLGLGPLLIPVLGCVGFLPYGIAAVMLLLAGLPLLALNGSVPHPRPPRIGEIAAVGRTAPILMLAVAVGAFFDGSVLPFWAIHGLEQGLPKDAAVLGLSLIKLGNIALQLPLGWVADRSSPRTVFLGCVIGTAIGAACLPLLDLTSWLAWPYLLVWGACGFGIFTMSLVQIGQRLIGPALFLGTAACGTMWGLGAFAGSAITGTFMAAFGALGLPASILSACVLLLVAIIIAHTCRKPVRPLP
ncbi:MAG: MFS transporter [Rhizobiales bacterium]|nr:MFS transporter [Hyphomicrobiales bacterium]